MEHEARLILICASPRRQGTSAMLLRRIQAKVAGELLFLPQEGDFTEIIDAMQRAETIVISGPTYVNSFPARLYHLLESAAEEGGFKHQKLYGIINGGMPYIHTHRHGLQYLSLFAESCELHWQGGFVLGGGAMLDGKDLEQHISKRKVVPAFNQFILNIREGKESADSSYIDAQKPMGKFITFLLSKLLTRNTEKRIQAFGHDPDAENYYLKNPHP